MSNIKINGTTLKIIACISMLIDHVSAIFLPQCFYLRVVGRIAFPIFAFLIAQGMVHTSDQNKYIGRLALLAVISEIPFDLAFWGEIYFGRQNVFFTLLIGAIAIKLGNEHKTLLLIVVALSANFLLTDYGSSGVLLILLFWIAKSNKKFVILPCLIFSAFYLPWSNLLAGEIPNSVVYYLQFFCLIACPLLLCYDGTRGGNGSHSNIKKWAFYFFYPAHLAILGILNAFIV